MKIIGDRLKRTGFNGHRKLGSIGPGVIDDQTQNFLKRIKEKGDRFIFQTTKMYLLNKSEAPQLSLTIKGVAHKSFSVNRAITTEVHAP